MKLERGPGWKGWDQVSEGSLIQGSDHRNKEDIFDDCSKEIYTLMFSAIFQRQQILGTFLGLGLLIYKMGIILILQLL